MAAAAVHAPFVGLYMLVVPALDPPLTNNRPSGKLVVPGQNILWLVSLINLSVAVFVAGSNSVEYVLPAVLVKSKRLSADHISTLPFGRFAAADGTKVSATGADHIA
ncbi:hypothetical protein [Methylibium sp. Root1272]|uniref:hypothetical protein n=1 Tax=Methylibium sp. Root1272 TaxID=1736441 RepID=UPI0006FA91E1|nr:hypothetical protein [Methylibium sp. Root1272]